MTSPDPYETVMRLAVLLTGGASPALAWGHLGAGGDPTALAAAAAAERGDDVGTVLSASGGAWGDIAVVYAVAVETGAPLAETLRSVAGSLRDAAEVSAEVRVVLAEPLATARLLGWLPVAGVPLGALLGSDTIGVLIGDPVGRACLVAGVVLIAAARAWTRRLARSARPSSTVPGLDAELWAVALSAGASPQRARTVIARRSHDVDERASRAVDDTLDLALRAGVPAAELLRADAWAARHRARTDGREKAARLSTRLLIPLGVCTLPAFLLLAVVPVVIGLLRSGTFP